MIVDRLKTTERPPRLPACLPAGAQACRLVPVISASLDHAVQRLFVFIKASKQCTDLLGPLLASPTFYSHSTTWNKRTSVTSAYLQQWQQCIAAQHTSPPPPHCTKESSCLHACSCLGHKRSTHRKC